jgi:hypothetical protein
VRRGVFAALPVLLAATRGDYRTTSSASCARPGPEGAWTPPALVLPGKGLIDPCPLFDDDGSVWLVHAWARSRSRTRWVGAKVGLIAAAPSSAPDPGQAQFAWFRVAPLLP